MATKLNKEALEHAKKLIKEGHVQRDERDDWSEHAPSAAQENTYIEKHGFPGFSSWHLGLDREASAGTKGSVTFPFGDFRKVHRCAVISLESRAVQHGHDDIAKAAKELLEKIDAG
ncbi:hypothetical protein [Arthrobacter sp. UYCu723]